MVSQQFNLCGFIRLEKMFHGSGLLNHFHKLVFVLLLALAAQWSFAETVQIRPSERNFSAQSISNSAESTTLKFSVDSYGKRDIFIDGKSFVLLEKPAKEGTIEEKGNPRLPRICRSIVISDEGIMGVQVISAEFIELTDIDIAPSKGHFSRDIEYASVPYTFGEAYQRDEFFPVELVETEAPHILRDLRGMTVKINAFRYNPVKRILRIYTDVTIEVKKTAPGGENVLRRTKPFNKIDPQFDKIYRRHFINYNQMDYPTCLEGGGMLVICYDDFMDETAPLVEWKNQKGQPTEMVPVSQVGTTSTAVKNFIRAYYETHDLGYVLLVGDAAQVATPAGGDSDPQYTQLAGGDSYSEIFVGRFSAENSAQVETQVERTINYEKFPDPTGTWYSRGLGDADADGPCNPEEYDYQHITILGNKLLRWNYTQVDSVYTIYGGTTNMIMNYMNQGCTAFSYAGHGWVNGVGPVNFTSTNANQLTNDNKLFHFTAVACQPGNFATNTCLAEDLLRATNHTTGAPTGAIAVYLSEISQSWFPPYDMQDEGFDILTEEEMLTFGGMCYNGGMIMIDLFGTQGINEFDAWTLFGDPSVYVRSMTPYALTVTHNPQIPIGVASFEVTVSGPSGLLPGAMVCAMNSEVYAAGITDNAGHITLTFNPPPQLPGELTLTVTTSNAIPYITEVDIISVTGPYIVFNSCVIQDALTGNNNGQWDFGETTQLGITLENVGMAVSGEVSGILDTENPLVTILDDSAFFGQIEPDSTMTLDGAFEVQISSTVEDGQAIIFNLVLNDGLNNWESNFSVIAHAPEVVFAGLDIDDAFGGNGNGCLDPGETADLLVTLTNSGSSGVSAVEAELSCADPYITITSAVSQCGNMNAGDSAEAVFHIQVSVSCPQDYDVDFDIDISGGGGYTDETGFTTTVGNILYMPTGPDAYGYYAYDDYDLPQTNLYQWVEISPDSGGMGTLIPFTSDDEILYAALPFAFQYYGIDYDSITISSNGFITLGITTNSDYSNSAIPDLDGPPSMIAAYWEDLSPQRPNSGKVWLYYDAVECVYIVEYNHIEQFSPTGNFETFQVIFYDPEEYSTFTGDGKIKVQYKSMSPIAQTEGTIGIENDTETIGLQYLFDGDYDIHAFPIADGSAILYSTLDQAPAFAVTLTPQGLPIVIPPGGGNFQYNVTIANFGPAITFDAWMEAVLPGGTVYGPIILRENLTLNPGGQLTRDMTQNIPGAAPAGTYIYRCKAGNYPEIVYDMDEFEFSKSGIDGGGNNQGWELIGWDGEVFNTAPEIPANYFLAQNSPNPFNPVTEIVFGLPEDARVEIRVFDILGREAAVLGEGWMTAGIHSVTFEAGKLSSGIYFYALQAGEYQAVRKMVVVK